MYDYNNESDYPIRAHKVQVIPLWDDPKPLMVSKVRKAYAFPTIQAKRVKPVLTWSDGSQVKARAIKPVFTDELSLTSKVAFYFCLACGVAVIFSAPIVLVYVAFVR